MPRKSSSSSSSTSKSTATSSASSSTGKSDYQYHQAYGGWNGFMHSYGLKTWDSNDVGEGKAIVEGFRAYDAAASEGGEAKK
ncbi:hypothetical protein BC826DRAFT_907446 [Russula brevipes]|nr:hypothetical protein BC826DRAFT_907446 [Russula brevipes]